MIGLGMEVGRWSRRRPASNHAWIFLETSSLGAPATRYLIITQRILLPAQRFRGFEDQCAGNLRPRPNVYFMMSQSGAAVAENQGKEGP